MALLAVAPAAHAGELRVCADPNDLPFSDQSQLGFENKIVALLARDMGDTVSYTWWAQRRGYVRNTLKAGTCDVWPGVAAGVDLMATTQPYYRSTYVFVSRADRHLHIASFDDPKLHQLTIGVQMIGNDAMNTPPAHALARRGMTANVLGFMVYGDYSQPNPVAAIVNAVAHGDIDVAVVWGPTAGYFAAHQAVKLNLTSVEPSQDGPQWPMEFSISMGVRKNDPEMLVRMNTELAKQRGAIHAILASYHVPFAE